MTGPDRPVRQPANTRASILRTGFLRLAAFPWMPETRTFISARGSFGRSVMHTPRRRETGRPRAAQFAPRAVYIPGGGTTWCGRKERRMVTADLLSRARAGDGEAFRELTEPHRRELQVHCYRMPDPSRMPRTPSKTLCCPPGKASEG